MDISTESDESLEIQRLRYALNNVPTYVFMKDTECRFTYVNKKTLELFGCAEENVIGYSDSCFFPEAAAKQLREVDLRVLQGERTQEEFVVTHADGSRTVYWDVKTPIYERAGSTVIVGLLGISTDISSRKDLEEKLQKAAFTDALTQLPNRYLLLDRLKQALHSSKRQNSHGALLFLDLNNFKWLNDTHGHQVGDQLLIEVACRLSKAVRDTDTVARLGGDEFVVLLEGLGSDAADAAEYVTLAVEKIHRLLTEEYVLGEIRHHGSASAGITLFLGDKADPEQIIKDADAAMYEAKRGVSVSR